MKLSVVTNLTLCEEISSGLGWQIHEPANWIPGIFKIQEKGRESG